MNLDRDQIQVPPSFKRVQKFTESVSRNLEESGSDALTFQERFGLQRIVDVVAKVGAIVLNGYEFSHPKSDKYKI